MFNLFIMGNDLENGEENKCDERVRPFVDSFGRISDLLRQERRLLLNMVLPAEVRDAERVDRERRERGYVPDWDMRLKLARMLGVDTSMFELPERVDDSQEK